MPADWISPVGIPPLGPGELQVWRIDLSDLSPATPETAAAKYLTSAELERSRRFRVEQPRTQFIVARACLRLLLANYLQTAPLDVPIVLGKYGKPEVATAPGSEVFFNLAHSQSTILIALSRDARVGIDVEYLDRKTEVLEIAETAFTPREVRDLAALDPAVRHASFFRLWTRKEAVVKADGRGLSLPLTSFEASSGSRSDFDVVSVNDGDYVSLYRIEDLPVGEDMAAAIAFAGSHTTILCLSFPLSLL